MTFGFYIDGNEVMTIDGMDAAYEEWSNFCIVADFYGKSAWMTDYKTGEIIVANVDDDF